MPIKFSAAANKLHAAVDRVWGESFTFAARKAPEDVNAPAIADDSRPSLTASGVWHDPSEAFYPDARGRESDHVQERVASVSAVTIRDSDLSWTPRKGDVVTRVENGAVYLVARTFPDGFNLTRLVLTAQRV